MWKGGRLSAHDVHVYCSCAPDELSGVFRRSKFRYMCAVVGRFLTCNKLKCSLITYFYTDRFRAMVGG